MAEDYAQVFGPLEPGDRLLVQEQPKADTEDPLLTVAARSSCGAHGCEYVIYERVGQECFRQVAVLTGSVEFMTPFRNERPRLRLIVHHDPGAGLPAGPSRVFYFSKLLKRYVPEILGGTHL